MRPIILGAKWPLGVSSTAGSGAHAEPVAGAPLAPTATPNRRRRVAQPRPDFKSAILDKEDIYAGLTASIPEKSPSVAEGNEPSLRRAKEAGGGYRTPSAQR